ncbi:hypothetical protein HID58_053193, partial [Brassica napus]
NKKTTCGKERERREKGDLSFLSGVRPARERFFWPLLRRLSPIALSELWIGTILQRWFPRVEGRRGRVEANGVRRDACMCQW